MKNSKNLLAGLITLIFAIILVACSENSIQNVGVDKDKNVKGPDYVPLPFPGDRYYTTDHVWVKLESENVALVGITTYPLGTLGTIVGTLNTIDETIGGQIRIPKKPIKKLIGQLSTFDVLMPVNGVIDGFNPEVDVNPAVINYDTYNLGWIFRITNFSMLEVQSLMNAAQYTTYVGGL